MKSFKSGVIVGIIGSAFVAAASAISYRQTVIKPAQKAEEHHDEVSKQAIRRSIAAHQSRF
ncbi:DUF3042 family protein [Leuconostoc citreum]